MIALFLSVLGMFGIWFVLFTPIIPNAVVRTLRKSNLPFFLDLIHTRSRRKTTRIVKASRAQRRRAARAMAKVLVV